MKTTFTSSIHFICLSLLLVLCLSFPLTKNSYAAASLETQRQQYLAAKSALEEGKITVFIALAEKLQTYPLYPYLRYNYLRTRLHKVPKQEIIDFMDTYPNFIATDSLRISWLKQLARQRKWQTFLDHYTQQQSPTLRCYQLQARINTNKQAYLLEDIRTVWLTGESLPDQCNQAFQLLYQSELMTDELVWKRIRLAMANNKIGLASYLARRLSQNQKIWAERWIATYHNPYRETRKVRYADLPITREILADGLKRLAHQSINRALRNWENLQSHYRFTSAEQDEVNAILAVRAAKRKHSKTIALLEAINSASDNPEVFHWRLLTALRNRDWQRLYQWTKAPPPEVLKYRWIYWRGRALEQLGETEKAYEAFASIADAREYYGFLAADRIGAPYQMNHIPSPANNEAIATVKNLPGIRRAKELYLLYNNYSARREWHHTLASMTSYQQQIAAKIAAEWGWHDRVIVTLGQARMYDNLELRFPLVYQDKITDYARERNLDRAWIFAVMRAESAFIATAKSPAGALGLMQVMPATGRLTAGKIKLRKFSTKDLLRPGTNIAIGTAYLKEMLDTFSGNYVLATAAYNAGPTQTIKWLPKKACQAADIWVEQIPFNETRNYVRRVLLYAGVYDWRLGLTVKPLEQRMQLVQPYRLNLVAAEKIPESCLS